MPELFHAFEDYHSGIGTFVIKRRTGNTFQKVILFSLKVAFYRILKVLPVGDSDCDHSFHTANAGSVVVPFLRTIHRNRFVILGMACWSFLHVHVHMEGVAHKYVHVPADAPHVPL